MLAELVNTTRALSPQERVARLRDLEAELRRAEAEVAVLVAEIERDGTARVDGHASIAGFLRAELRWSAQQVCTRRRLARLVDAVPDVIEHLACGAIGVAQAHLFGRAAANPRCGNTLGEHAEVLLRQARVLEHDAFGISIRTWEQLADTDGSLRDADTNHANRGLCSPSSTGSGASSPSAALATMPT